MHTLRGHIINLIRREELKEELARGDDFKLVMVLGDWVYQAKHIPGSLNISRIDDGIKALDVDDEIVVYYSDEACVASRMAYQLLVDRGLKNVRRYAGGLSDWEDSGHPLEGEMVTGQ